MIPYHVYKVMHLTAIFMIVLSLGGMAFHAISGGGRNHPFRKNLARTHGVGLLLALIAGFGLLARLGFAHNQWPPGWAMAKIGIWLLLGGLSAVLLRKPQWGKPLWIGIIFLTGTAAYLANYKPF